MITPVAIETIGYRYYIVYAVIGACIPASIYFFYPETMGRKLEDIDMIFRESPSVWSTVRYARVTPDSVIEERTMEKVKMDRSESVAEY